MEMWDTMSSRSSFPNSWLRKQAHSGSGYLPLKTECTPPAFIVYMKHGGLFVCLFVSKGLSQHLAYNVLIGGSEAEKQSKLPLRGTKSLGHA